jgi:hypothetical protein
VALAGQALKFLIDAVQRRRDHAWWQSAGGCVQAAAVPCPGPGHPLPRPWTARSCGRASTRRAQGGAGRPDGPCGPGGSCRSNGPCPGEASRPPAPGARPPAARWDCRGRTRRHPHGRHRRS